MSTILFPLAPLASPLATPREKRENGSGAALFGTFATGDFLPSSELALSMAPQSQGVAATRLKRAEVVLLLNDTDRRRVDVWACKAGSMQCRVGSLLSRVGGWLAELLVDDVRVIGALDVLFPKDGAAPRYRLVLRVYLARPALDGSLLHAAASPLRQQCWASLCQACAAFKTAAASGAARTSTYSFKHKTATPTATPTTTTTTTTTTRIIATPSIPSISLPAGAPAGVPAFMALMESGSNGDGVAAAAVVGGGVVQEEVPVAERRDEPKTKRCCVVVVADDDHNNNNNKDGGNNDTQTQNHKQNVPARKMFTLNLPATACAPVGTGSKQTINGVPLVTASSFSAASSLCGSAALAALPKPEFKVPMRVGSPKKRSWSHEPSVPTVIVDANNNNNKEEIAETQQAKSCRFVGDDEQSAASLLVALATRN